MSKPKKAPAPRKKATGYRMPDPIKQGEVITDTSSKKSWKLGPIIGTGGFGAIYSACEEVSKKGSNYDFVIKIEPHENGPLFVERNFYLRNGKIDDVKSFMQSKKISTLGMPVYYGGGTHTYNGSSYRFLVMERFGKDIWNIFVENNQKFPTGTVFLLGLQMLDALEYIHSRGYVHADLKGSNILMGTKKGTENQAYLVDFGLATRVTEGEFKPDPKCAHNGTIEYTSCDAHLGEATMRGDLEILAYNMLIWLTGSLPWLKQTDPKIVHKMKQDFMSNIDSSMTKHYKAVTIPNALIAFFKYVKTLKPKEVPNYKKCKEILEKGLKDSGLKGNKLVFTNQLEASTSKSPKRRATSATPKKKNTPASDETSSTVDLSDEETPKSVGKRVIRKAKPSRSAKVITKKTAKATPPVKRNHANTACQTSIEKKRASNSTVNESENSIDVSRDVFDESPIPTPKKRKIMPKKRVVTKVVTTTVTKTKSWRDTPAVVHGRAPPKL